MKILFNTINNIAIYQRQPVQKQARINNQPKYDTISFQARTLNAVPELSRITSDNKVFERFVKQVINNPRKSGETVNNLLKQAGSTPNFINWYLQKGGYKEKYSEFINNYLNKAKKPEDLLKISPNWGIWTFENKFGNDFFIGNVPKDIGNKQSYRKLVEKLLKNSDTGLKVKEFTNGLSGKRTFSLETDQHKYILKTQQDFSLYSKELKKALEKDKWLYDSFIKIHKENENMKSDSSYINAMIDFYLNLNNCPNAAKIHCFDAKTSSVLYDYVDGKELTGRLDIREVNKKLPDLKALGIVYNDINAANLKEQNGIIKIIDSGESSFNDVLKPAVPGLQIELPNWSGNSILSLISGINYINF